MTKRWSSTASLDGQTKRQASKSVRAKAKREYNPAMVTKLLALDAMEPEAGFDNIDDLLKYLNEESR